MRIVPITSIVVPPNRQREYFKDKDLVDLAQSILEKGLFHPIVVRNDGVTLVAGERRLRSVFKIFHDGIDSIMCNGEELPSQHIAVTLLGELTPYEIREAELDENIRRIDLSWQERSRALAELHQLRMEQALERGETHTIRDTASEILGVLDTDVLDGAAPADAKTRKDISAALTISKYLDDPEVAAAKTAKDAMKVIERKATIAHRETLLAELGVEGIRSDHTILTVDTLTAIESFTPKRLFDVILTDPPYGVDADAFGEQAAARHEYADTIEHAMSCYLSVFQNASRLTRPNAFLFAFCDIRLFDILKQLAEKTLAVGGWNIWDTPIIWSKSAGMLPVPDFGPRRTYESVLYAYRGTRKWQTTGSPDVIEHSTVPQPEFGAQKPVELFADLLGRVSQPGDHVFDPFAGTCPLIGAAKKHHCIATCWEADPRKVTYAKLQANA